MEGHFLGLFVDFVGSTEVIHACAKTGDMAGARRWLRHMRFLAPFSAWGMVLAFTLNLALVNALNCNLEHGKVQLALNPIRSATTSSWTRLCDQQISNCCVCDQQMSGVNRWV